MITQFVQTNNCEVTQLDDEFIILNTDNFTITRLNDVGGFCWSLLHESQTLDSIILAFQAKYELSSETLKSDIRIFLSELVECGLVQNPDG